MTDFSIDPEFRDLLDGLRDEERAGLEASIRADGCRDALIVWAEEKILVDGHNRYAICNELGITPRLEMKSFPSRNDVLLWIIDNQMSRRNVTEARRIALALKREPILAAQAKARHIANGGDKKSDTAKSAMVKGSPPISEGDSPAKTKESHTTRNAIAKAANSTGTNVQRVKAVLAKADDETKEKMLAGEIPIRTAYNTVMNSTATTPSPPEIDDELDIEVEPVREPAKPWPEDDWQCVKIKVFDTLRKFYAKHPLAQVAVISDLKKFVSSLQK